MALLHPDHAIEQAYIENAYGAMQRRLARLKESPAAAPDKATARAMRKHVLARLKDPVDLEAICFGRIDYDDGPSLYLGREGIHDDGKLLVVNWRVPKA